MIRLIPDSFIRRRWLAALARIEYGTLTFVTPEGETLVFTGAQPGAQADFRIGDWSVIRRLALRGDIGLGEDYIAGKWETESLEQLFSLFLTNMEALRGFADGHPLMRALFRLYTTWLRRNSKNGSSRNIMAHYDVGNDFYRLWLDPSMTYSSALFEGGSTDLEEAQGAKYKRILSRISGEKVLEIGCGWGGFAEAAAKKDHKVTALTISPAQYDYARERLKDKADVLLRDYREVKGLFDAIVSIEMFEAVGERYWPVFFETIGKRLKHGGTAVVQTITIGDHHFTDYRRCSDFIRHYVFPGGMLPSMQRFREEAEGAGLVCREVFAFGTDYARTLRDWLGRFEGQREAILAMGYNDAFIRNWRFYLSICAAAFAIGRTNVVQVELTHA